MSFKVALLPRSFTPTEHISSMSLSGLQVNKTPPLVRARGKAINGLIGEKEKQNSAPSPMPVPPTFNSSSGFSRSSHTKEHAKQCPHGRALARLHTEEEQQGLAPKKRENKSVTTWGERGIEGENGK